MNIDSNLLNIIVSILTGGITAFAVVSYKMGRYSEKIDQLEKCNLNQRLSTLEGSYNARRDVGAFTQYNSPISLNDKGEDLLNKSKGKDFVDKKIDYLVQEVEKLNPKTAYDIQELSKKVIKSESAKDDFTPIKDYIFKEGIELEVAIVVLGIYLRDEILKRKGFQLDDVDLSDPKKNGK